MRFDALYRRDRDGRLVETNEWDARPAPRFHLMTGPRGPIWSFGQTVSPAIAVQIASLAADEPWRPDADVLPVHAEAYERLLGADAPVERRWRGPAFAALDPRPHGGGACDATEALVAPLFEDWLSDVAHRRPFKVIVEGERAVALCASVRISPRVHCAGVETHAEHRRRGHALAAVEAWADDVRALGATPFYSTSWANLASRAVAARAGLTLVACDYHLT